MPLRSGMGSCAVDMIDEYTRYYMFLEKGEWVKTVKTIVAFDQLGGKKKFYVRAGTTGEIINAPVIKSKAQKLKEPSDTWVYVKFANGREGWARIRYLCLIGATS